MNKRLKNFVMCLVPCAAVSALTVGYVLSRLSSPGLPKARVDAVRVICVGDSITYGAGIASSDRAVKSYPAQLQELLGNSYQVLNYGVNGTTLSMAGDFPYRDSKSFRSSKEADPNVVLIMLGTNDTKAHNWNGELFEEHLIEFVAFYKALPSHPEVFVISPPAAFANSFGINQRLIKEEVAPIVRRVATQTNTSSIDVFSATNDHPEYFLDGVHPSVAGNRLIAATAHATLQVNLTSRLGHMSHHSRISRP